MIELDIMIEEGDWETIPDVEVLAQKAASAALAVTYEADEECEASLMLTDDAQIQELNRNWRGKDKPTNVLSFPAFPVVPGDPLPPMLGDIVLAIETISREASLEKKPFEHHLTHLIVHGFLHLLGYDHETDEEAEVMEAMERRVLARLAIPDPYA